MAWQDQPRDLRGRFRSRWDEWFHFEDYMRRYLPLPRRPQPYPNRDEFEAAFHMIMREHYIEPMPR